MMVSFVLSFFPRDVLDEILNLIESVSEDFPSYSYVSVTNIQWGWSGGAMVLGKLPVPGRPTILITVGQRGWSGGAKVLGKLPVPGRPTNLDYSGAKAYCACNRCGRGLFGHFFSLIYHFFSFSLSLGDDPI